MEKLKKLLKTVLASLPGRYILLESAPDLSDNTKAVFDEMIRRGLNKKYKFVWLCRDSLRDYPKIKNVIYFPAITTRIDQWRFSYYHIRARLAICCNRFIHPTNPNAVIVYLQHGTGVKDTRKSNVLPSYIWYVVAASNYAAKNTMWELNIEEAKVSILGFPRNDVFCEEGIDLHKVFTNRKYNKIIVWYPTYRQHKGGSKTGSSKALPILWNDEKAKLLNQCAKENDILIVLKPHFAQDVSSIKTLDLSNIIFIDDNFFFQNGITSYRFVGNCDALLTDYSSIYFDYTLCDKPIGLIWEDYEEYAANPGFAVDMDAAMKGGVKIYTLEELENFVRDIATGVDRLKQERREVRDLYNYSTDGKNSERVVDFLIEKAKL